MKLSIILIHLLQAQDLGDQTLADAVKHMLTEELPPRLPKEELLTLLKHEEYIQVIQWACADLIVMGKPQPDTIDLLGKLPDLDTRFVAETVIMAISGNPPWKKESDGRLLPFIHKAKKAVEKFCKGALTPFSEKDLLFAIREIITGLLAEYRQHALAVLATP